MTFATKRCCCRRRKKYFPPKCTINRAYCFQCFFFSSKEKCSFQLNAQQIKIFTVLAVFSSTTTITYSETVVAFVLIKAHHFNLNVKGVNFF